MTISATEFFKNCLDLVCAQYTVKQINVGALKADVYTIEVNNFARKAGALNNAETLDVYIFESEDQESAKGRFQGCVRLIAQ
ncbi:hypothetical protein [Vibrio harveyi]|uniref:hypothetical protein n=1 Tax=Vibrio harveyi TaxID=669 RepID=UPI0018F1CFE8|nr:hypothetical protein [Vibrio harveyi]